MLGIAASNAPRLTVPLRWLQPLGRSGARELLQQNRAGVPKYEALQLHGNESAVVVSPVRLLEYLLLVVVAATPLLLMPAVGPFQAPWGQHAPGLWPHVVAPCASFLAFVLAARLLLRSSRIAPRSRYMRTAVYTVLLAPPLFIGLFWLVGLAAFHMTLPYALLGATLLVRTD